jgi:hypothetical protein
MSDYARIAERYDFIVPDQYRRVRATGLLDRGSPNELFLTDLEWLSTDAIAVYQFLEFEIKGLIPLARTARRDLFCWYPHWGTDKDIPVTFCPRDDENATCYASDFVGFLYRILLEEFSGSWLVDSFGVADTAERFRRYAIDVSQFLPDSWATTLCQLSTEPLIELEQGLYGVMNRRKCDDLIAKTLFFPRLNQEFKHYIGE